MYDFCISPEDMFCWLWLMIICIRVWRY